MFNFLDKKNAKLIFRLLQHYNKNHSLENFNTICFSLEICTVSTEFENLNTENSLFRKRHIIENENCKLHRVWLIFGVGVLSGSCENPCGGSRLPSVWRSGCEYKLVLMWCFLPGAAFLFTRAGGDYSCACVWRLLFPPNRFKFRMLIRKLF